METLAYQPCLCKPDTGKDALGVEGLLEGASGSGIFGVTESNRRRSHQKYEKKPVCTLEELLHL